MRCILNRQWKLNKVGLLGLIHSFLNVDFCWGILWFILVNNILSLISSHVQKEQCALLICEHKCLLQVNKSIGWLKKKEDLLAAFSMFLNFLCFSQPSSSWWICFFSSPCHLLVFVEADFTGIRSHRPSCQTHTQTAVTAVCTNNYLCIYKTWNNDVRILTKVTWFHDQLILKLQSSNEHGSASTCTF